ncbi:hypothetical protein CBR_g52303 [Chara braunii]|uniref:Integrase catalytic domain-containing protein n=1 Tax=Chara braunii TaxID=69332 RepID=A0A388MA26_CHABU|nr:hypothetical protein CBR_g52303 [Chara braunii]|eukprot:GBG91416.1 hypothetical protein CBR_g52303 [Chara braunii]
MQGPGQSRWVPKTAIAAPKPFTGDKRGEDLDTWLWAVPVYAKCKLTLPHEEVLVVASYLEGSARWLSGLVQLQGYGHDFHAWAAHQKLEDFLKMVEDRWHDPQEAQKATDAIPTLHTRQFKSVREATDVVERLICVPGVRYDPQVLLTSYLRCFPMPLRNQLAGEANINMHNFPLFSKKALDLEVKIGHGQTPTTDGRKKTVPPNWKVKGHIMFVDNDGSTIELDNDFQLGVGSEAGNVEASGGGVVTAIAKKGKASGRRRGGSWSRSQVDPNAPPREKAGLTEDMWRDRYGLYEFVVMPFGLCDAPGTFQHAMNRIFHDYLDKFVIVYLDDVLIFSRTVEEHVTHLDKVLSLLRQHKFKINGEKCEFGRTRILYLGHEISTEGLKPDDAKVASIRDWPRPQSVTEMRSFLGMTGYYRNFVKNYSIVATPLTDLLRLDAPWEWTDICEVAFRHLKHALTHHEVLKLPDSDKPFIVTTDASLYGIGVVLAQQEGPKLRPVEYMSKKMPSQKLAKSTYEKKLYTIYKALTHWRHYLLGRFSKYARLVAMPETAKTEYVIKLFTENWVRDFGLPKSIISDQDVRFTSELWKAAAAEQGTQLQMTSGNHPEANGQAEQLNRVVLHDLECHSQKLNQARHEEQEQEAAKRQSQAEIRMVEEIKSIEIEKEIIRRNRALRSQQLAEELERRWEQFLARDREIGRMMYNEFAELREEENRRLQEMKREREEDKHLRRVAFCRDLVLQWRSAKALKGTMDDLVAVPDHGVTEPQLVQLFYRAIPKALRGHFFDKSQQAGITYDQLNREVVLYESKSMPVTTFWHKDLEKGKKWKNRTILGQVKAKDHMILTLEEGGTDEVPYDQIEWGLEDDGSSVGQGRSYAAVAARGRPQGGGGGQGQRGQAMGG